MVERYKVYKEGIKGIEICEHKTFVLEGIVIENDKCEECDGYNLNCERYENETKDYM